VFTARFDGIPLRRQKHARLIDGGWPTRRRRQLIARLTAGIRELCDARDDRPPRQTTRHPQPIPRQGPHHRGAGHADQPTEDPDRLRPSPRHHPPAAHPAVAPLESRMRGNAHVRFGSGRSRAEKAPAEAPRSAAYSTRTLHAACPRATSRPTARPPPDMGAGSPHHQGRHSASLDDLALRPAGRGPSLRHQGWSVGP